MGKNATLILTSRPWQVPETQNPNAILASVNRETDRAMEAARTPSKRYHVLSLLNKLARQLYNKWDGGHLFPLAPVHRCAPAAFGAKSTYNPAPRVNGLIGKLIVPKHFELYMAALVMITDEALDIHDRVVANRATNHTDYRMAMEKLNAYGYQDLKPGQKFLREPFLGIRRRFLDFTPQQLADLKEYYMYWEEDPVAKDEWLGKLTKLETHLTESFYRGLEAIKPKYRQDGKLAG